ERLRAEERLTQFAAALPARARVSEPVLPLVLAALHEEVGRGLIVVLPEDADARDAAEAASWFLGDEQVALFPSRGVHWGSGLEPPPHLVGERARALDVLERGGLVCASAAAVAEGLPPAAERPAALRVARGEEPGIELLAEHLASAGYERVERVEERGQFAVRARARSRLVGGGGGGRLGGGEAAWARPGRRRRAVAAAAGPAVLLRRTAARARGARPL